jgi:hypothetical protein
MSSVARETLSAANMAQRPGKKPVAVRPGEKKELGRETGLGHARISQIFDA